MNPRSAEPCDQAHTCKIARRPITCTSYHDPQPVRVNQLQTIRASHDQALIPCAGSGGSSAGKSS